MKKEWHVAGVTVSAEYSLWWSRSEIKVDGLAVLAPGAFSARAPGYFYLPGGRSAQFWCASSYGKPTKPYLEVDGVACEDVHVADCEQCGAHLSATDKFCDSCGAPADSVRRRLREKHVRTAVNTMNALAVIFLVAGFFLYLSGRGEHLVILDKLQGLKSTDTWPTPVNGAYVTAGELRLMVQIEMWSPLAVNGLLGAIMFGLGLVCRRYPIAAIVSALAVYSMVVVGNAIVDPVTLIQGLILKFIVYASLGRSLAVLLDNSNEETSRTHGS